MAKKKTAKKATVKKKAAKRVSRKTSAITRAHLHLDKGYRLPKGYEVKHIVVKKRATKKRK